MSLNVVVCEFVGIQCTCIKMIVFRDVEETETESNKKKKNKETYGIFSDPM